MLEYLLVEGRLEAALKYHSHSPRSIRQELISLFHKGKRAQFLRLLALLQHQQKLQFYLRVYFLIFNIHPALKAKTAIPEQEVIAFKQFLDSKGAELAKTNEFLEFYALPFVKKPMEHVSFKILFKREWVNNLTEKLQIYLQRQEKRIQMVAMQSFIKQSRRGSPQLGKQASPTFPEPVSNMRQLQQKNRLLFDEIEQFRIKYAQLERNNQALIESFSAHLMQSQNKWFAITKQLTNNSKLLIDLVVKEGSAVVKDRRFQKVKKRTQKFQKMVKKEIEDLINQSQDLSVFDKPSFNQVSVSASVTPNVSQKNITTFVSIEDYTPTNYIPLIRDFQSMSAGDKVRVLQGFSWRIIKAKNKWVRRQTIVGLIVNDVLGLMSGDVQLLLSGEELQQQTIRLFLYISEDSYGNRVVFRNGGLYKQIMELVPTVQSKKNYVCLNILLEILQNIWHSKEVLLELINLNIVDMCITLLQDPDVLQEEEILEQIVTLMLNITAIDQGLQAYEQQINIFYTLSQAFKQANDSNRNLIGAIIYALLGRKSMWKLAHQAKLPDFIEDLIKLDLRSNKQQLKLIQEKLHNFQPGETLQLEEYEDLESIDSNLEEEIFSRNQSQLVNLQDYIKSHEWLGNKYTLRGSESDEQIDEINQIIEQFKKDQEEIKPEPAQKAPAGRPYMDPKRQKERIAAARLPQIKQRKDNSNPWVAQTKPKPQKKQESINKRPQIAQKRQENNQSLQKPKAKNYQNQYYSYKSPQYKHQHPRQPYSMRVESAKAAKDKGISFQAQAESQIRARQRAQTKPDSSQIEDKSKNKKAQPEYRIKKSTSVEKGIGNVAARQGIASYETNQNQSNVADYKSADVMRSPPKKNREELLRQLNQQLKAEKKGDQDRKISAKNIQEPLNARENVFQKKKDNYVTSEAEKDVFMAKPKIRRTPPKQDQ